eukprot:408405_1
MSSSCSCTLIWFIASLSIILSSSKSINPVYSNENNSGIYAIYDALYTINATTGNLTYKGNGAHGPPPYWVSILTLETLTCLDSKRGIYYEMGVVYNDEPYYVQLFIWNLSNPNGAYTPINTVYVGYDGYCDYLLYQCQVDENNGDIYVWAYGKKNESSATYYQYLLNISVTFNNTHDKTIINTIGKYDNINTVDFPCCFVNIYDTKRQYLWESIYHKYTPLYYYIDLKTGNVDKIINVTNSISIKFGIYHKDLDCIIGFMPKTQDNNRPLLWDYQILYINPVTFEIIN